jgi:threonine/homoserine/homoserine lactone efflux protein
VASDRLLAFALTALVLIAVPGPSVLFAISRALTIGRRGALLTVVGNAAGGYLQVVAVAFGVGALVEPPAFVERHAVATPPASTRTHRVLAEGFMVGVANPKAAVFFLAGNPAAARLR